MISPIHRASVGRPLAGAVFRFDFDVSRSLAGAVFRFDSSVGSPLAGAVCARKRAALRPIRS